MERSARGDEEVAGGEGEDEREVHAQRGDDRDGGARPLRPHASSAARPRGAKSPCGRFWMKTMMKASTAILASTAPDHDSSSLLAKPRPSAAYTVPASWPTPPSTTTMNESTMYDWPRSGPTLPIGEGAQPASPASPEPSPKAHVSTRAVGTP